MLVLTGFDAQFFERPRFPHSPAHINRPFILSPQDTRPSVQVTKLQCTCTVLGVLCCFALFVCLTLLACFFLSSFSSLIKNIYEHVAHSRVHIITVHVLWKSDCLECAVLLCFVCMTLLASFFLHLSLTCICRTGSCWFTLAITIERSSIQFHCVSAVLPSARSQEL